MKTIRAIAGQAVAITGQIRRRDTGYLAIESGNTLDSLTIREDFGDYSESTLLNKGDWVDPPAGTPESPHPLWNPAVDGVLGFNFLGTIAGSSIPAPGTYIVELAATVNGYQERLQWRILVSEKV